MGTKYKVIIKSRQKLFKNLSLFSTFYIQGKQLEKIIKSQFVSWNLSNVDQTSFCMHCQFLVNLSNSSTGQPRQKCGITFSHQFDYDRFSRFFLHHLISESAQIKASFMTLNLLCTNKMNEFYLSVTRGMKRLQVCKSSLNFQDS